MCGGFKGCGSAAVDFAVDHTHRRAVVDRFWDCRRGIEDLVLRGVTAMLRRRRGVWSWRETPHRAGTVHDGRL